MVGARRVSSKSRCKALACAGAWAALWSPALHARAAHVENRCPRLSRSEYEELDARVLLLLLKQRDRRQLPAVVCTPERAWLEWEGQSFDLPGHGSIADEAVEIVESQLQPPGPAAGDDTDVTEAENAAVAEGRPMLQAGGGTPPPLPSVGQPADPLALRADDARGGGIVIGIETELGSPTVGTALGPAFEVGTTVGPLLLGGREAARFTVSGRQLVFMDFEGLLGYGAPFNPDALLGAVARFGAEWMVAYPEGNSGQAAVVPVIDLGLRVQKSLGLVGTWVGIDTHFRMARLSLGTATPLTANDVGLSLTLGVAFLDWSRK